MYEVLRDFHQGRGDCNKARVHIAGKAVVTAPQEVQKRTVSYHEVRMEGRLKSV